MRWHKLLSRADVDLPTLSEADAGFFAAIAEFTGKRDEHFFSTLEGKNFSHFIGIDSYQFGIWLFNKYMGSPKKIKELYEDGSVQIRQFVKNAAQRHGQLDHLDVGRKDIRDRLLNAFVQFRGEISGPYRLYTPLIWTAIVAWEQDFERILADIIKKNHLNSEQQKYLISSFKPWKATSIVELNEKIRKGEDVKKLAREYQFLRSWAIIWYKEIDENWIKQACIKKEGAGVEGDDVKKLKIKERVKIKEKLNLKLTDEEKKYFELLPYVLFFKDWRDDARRRFVYSWNFLFRLISERYNIHYNDLGYLILDEIEAILTDSIDVKTAITRIEQRKSHGAVLTSYPDTLKVKVFEGIPDRYKAIISDISSDAINENNININSNNNNNSESNNNNNSNNNNKYIKTIVREYKVLYSEIVIKSVSSEVRHILSYVPDDMFVVPEQSNSCFYSEKTRWNKFRQSLINDFARNKAAFDRFTKMFYGLGKRYVETAKQLSSSKSKNLNNNLSALSDDELREGFKKYFKIWRDYTSIMWATFLMNDDITNKAVEVIEEHAKRIGKSDKAFDYISIMLEPEKKAGIKTLNEKIMMLKKHGFSEADLKNLAEEFAWVPCLDLHNKPWSVADVKRYIEEFDAGTDKLSETSLAQRHQTPRNEVLKELGIKGKDLELVNIAHEFSYIKDLRDDYRRIGVYNVRPFMAEIARRMDMKTEDIGFLRSGEILGFIDAGINTPASDAFREEIDMRKKGFMMYMEDDKVIVSADKKDIEQLKAKYGFSSKPATSQHAGSSEIYGVRASLGKARGIARIVLSAEDLGKVKKGDVMIAITTHPDFVPAMNRACAIVTDEGGMTSHAAIVSREMRKPCIVGTKNATKLLKDGDIVEVDAEKGVVKKINS